MTLVTSPYSLLNTSTGGASFTVKNLFYYENWGFGGWVKPLAADMDSGQHRLIGRDGTYGTWLNTGKIRFHSDSGDVFSVGSLIQDEWNHFFLTNSASLNKVSIYINGVFDKQFTGNTIYANNWGSTSGSTGGGASVFYGSFDDLRIYSREVTAEEVANLYAGLEISTTSLWAYWKLDEGTGTTAADSSGNGRNATLSGQETWQASPEVPAPLLAPPLPRAYLYARDGESRVRSFIKQPSEVLSKGFIVNNLVTGVTIDSVTVSAIRLDRYVTDNDVLGNVYATIANTDDRFYVLLQDGEDGVDYKITFVYTCSDGSIGEEDLIMQVRDL